jgi:hypothetical protein
MACASASPTFGRPTHPQNFVVFGEMGVGKSSLINLIAGKELAEVSSGAKSCTLDSKEHTIDLTDYQRDIRLYDTVSKHGDLHDIRGILRQIMQAGLNEPSMNNASYVDALVNAHKLIQSLRENGGIHGLLFCIRGGRITNIAQQNYKLFYEFLCQEKVPIALVINGLENEPDMDGWWTQNRNHIEKSGIDSVNHVCITTVMGHDNAYERRYWDSRKKVHKMLNELAHGTGYSADVSSWFGRMCKKLREFLVPGSKVPWLGKSHDKMMKELTRRYMLRKEDAVQFLQRIGFDENNR